MQTDTVANASAIVVPRPVAARASDVRNLASQRVPAGAVAMASWIESAPSLAGVSHSTAAPTQTAAQHQRAAASRLA